MTISKQIELFLEQINEQLDSLQFGSIDFIIHNGTVIRVDIRNSIKPEIKKIKCG